VARAPAHPSPRRTVPQVRCGFADHCDDEKTLVFSTLDSEPLNDYEGKVKLVSPEAPVDIESVCVLVHLLDAVLAPAAPHSRVPGFCEHQHQLGG
jgi:hypothetical protein